METCKLENDSKFTVLKTAIGELERALTRETIAGRDRLSEWAARQIKVASPFGNDHVILDISARHKVGANEIPLRHVASKSLRIIRALLELGIDVKERNGQAVSS